MPQGASREAYLTDGYGNSLDDLGRTSLDRDLVFSDGYDSQLATVDGEPIAGYTASLRIVCDPLHLSALR